MSETRERQKGKARDVPKKFRAGWLDRLDGRYAVAQEVRARFEALTQDLGGLDVLSYQQRSLCERAIWLEHWLARQERALAAGGKDFDIGQWVQASNGLLGLYRHVGLQRRAKPAETLEGYKRRIAAEQTGGTSTS